MQFKIFYSLLQLTAYQIKNYLHLPPRDDIQKAHLGTAADPPAFFLQPCVYLSGQHSFLAKVVVNVQMEI